MRQAKGSARSPLNALRLICAIVHALISKHRTECQWRMLPADVPPISAVRSYFDKWKRNGTFVRINDALRKQARTAPGRDEAPSISVLDSQTAKTTEAGGEHGYDEKKDTRAQASVLG